MEIIFLGLFFHFIGGFASGSFYIPYKKVKGWAWESFWIVGGICSWLIVPPLAPRIYNWCQAFYGDITFKATQVAKVSFNVYLFLAGLLLGHRHGLTYGLECTLFGRILKVSTIILGLCFSIWCA